MFYLYKSEYYEAFVININISQFIKIDTRIFVAILTRFEVQ